MHFHWLIKHKVGKKDPNYEQPEEIEVDDFIRQIGEKEIEIDLESIEPEEKPKDASDSSSEPNTDDIRRIFDSSDSESDNVFNVQRRGIDSLTNMRSRDDDNDPMIITVTIPGNGTERSIKRSHPMEENEQNQHKSNRIVREIDNEEIVEHEALISKSQLKVQTEAKDDKRVSESSSSEERTH